MRLGVVGTGTIATAVVRGIAADGHHIVVSERGAANASALAGAFENVSVASNQGVLDASEVVFLGLLPDAAPAILEPLRFRPDHRVISLIGGSSPGEVADMVTPAAAEAIVLPFPGIAQGGSPVLTLGNAELVHAIFGARNQIFALQSAAELDAHLSAQAVLSPVAILVDMASGWLAQRTGDPEKGDAFLRALVASSLSRTPCNDLLAALNTPGGYNQRLRQHMEGHGMPDALIEGLNALEGHR